MTRLTAPLDAALSRQRIETPSWGYGNSGTRFKTFAAPGAARDVSEKSPTAHREAETAKAHRG